MITKLTGQDLPQWMAAAREAGLPGISSFAKGLELDLDAVTNGLTMNWSSGPVEGRVNHKMIKRQMSGRAGLPLLARPAHRPELADATARLAAPCPGTARINRMVNRPETVVVPYAQRDIPAESVLALYRAAGWWPERTADQVRAVLQASPAVGAWHGQDLIGFARAVSDGILRAYVEDVIVSPSWRGRGVGRALLDGLTEQLRLVPVVTLFCSPDLVPYYEASSFKKTRQVVMHRNAPAPEATTADSPS